MASPALMIRRWAEGPPARVPPDQEGAGGPPEIEEDWHLAPRLARMLVAVVFSGLVTVGVLRIFASPVPGHDKALGVAYFAAMLMFQLRLLQRRPAPLNSKVGAAALVAQVVVAYLPFVQFGQSWAGMPGFLAGSCLLVLPGVAAWAAFATVVGSMAYVQHLLTGGPLDVTYTTVSTVITGLLVYGLTRLAALVDELREARAQIAMLAVAQERLRVSRDLHDLLGYSISAIALKSELTARLIGTQPDRARAEVHEILDISRRALGDVRSLARSYREMSLQDEIRSARSMLLAADVTTRVDLSGGGSLPTDVETVLAIVLREGVTNVLRHSHAVHCEISVRRDAAAVHFEIVNDGVEAESPTCPGGGSGLGSLSARVAAVGGGGLSAGELPGGRWRLHVSVPLAAAEHRGRQVPAEQV